jgi:hypothetical protein
LLCATSTLAQPRIRVLALAGDPAPGPVIGNYTVFDNVLVNNAGDWLIAATTNAFDPDANSVVVKNCVQVRAENDPATPLVGLNIGLPQELSLSNSGDVWYQFSLRNATSSTDSAIDLNGNVVIQEGGPAAGFSAGTNFIGFFRVYAGADKQALMIGTVDDPLITSTVDRGLYRLDGVGPGFTTVTQTLLAKEGDVLPGQTNPLTDFITSFHEAAMSQSGTPMFKASISGAGTAMYIGSTLLAQTPTSAGPGLPRPQLDRFRPC